MARLRAERGGRIAALAVGLLAVTALACGSAAGGTGGGVSPTGGSMDPSAGGATVSAAGGSATGGGPAGEGGFAQAGEASWTGGSSSDGGITGNGGIEDTPAAGAGIAGADCSLVGCAPAPWCGQECQSPCGCCPCQQGSVDAQGNRCDDGCWLATAGDAHCQQPWDAGPCDAAIPVYWFNAATQRCEPLTYGGCQGNANRFESLDFCEQDCAPIPGPSDELLPVVYAFGDGCHGEPLTEAGRQIVTDFVAAKVHDPPGDDPHIRVNLMAGNGSCARMPDMVLTGTGVEAFVDYIEYGAMGYPPAHQTQIPKDEITRDMSELSVALGVDPPQIDWR